MILARWIVPVLWDLPHKQNRCNNQFANEIQINQLSAK